MKLLKKLVFVPAIAFFVYFGFVIKEFSFAGVFGALAISIAMGAINYYQLRGINRKQYKTSLGTPGRETGLYAGVVIPNKVGVYVMLGILCSCLISFVLYINGL
jgi:hypothetical protein